MQVGGFLRSLIPPTITISVTMLEGIVGALALLAEGIIFFCLHEPETVARIGKIGKYAVEMLKGWAVLMSTLSVALLFVPLLLPNKIVQSWCIWLGAAFCFVVANFIVWNRGNQRAQVAEHALEEVEKAKPKIVLREPNAIHVQDIGMGIRVSGVPHTEKTVPFVKVRFVNKPKGNYPNSVAQKVSARIRISDLSGKCQVDMAGRWDDTTQPSFIAFGFSKTDLQFVDFGILQERGLDIAFRDIDGSFVAWNNDNYDYQDMRKPEHVLTGKEFQVEIKLSAVWVDETFVFQFGSGGASHGVVITT